VSKASRRRRRGKDDEIRGENFVLITNDLIDSAAWRSLKPRTVWAFVMLKRNYENDRFTLSSRSVRGMMAAKTLRLALDELTAAGFISCVNHGGLYRRPDVYVLSDGWIKHSEALLKDEAQGKTQGKLWHPARPRRKSENSEANLKGVQLKLIRSSKKKMPAPARPRSQTD